MPIWTSLKFCHYLIVLRHALRLFHSWCYCASLICPLSQHSFGVLLRPYPQSKISWSINSSGIELKSTVYITDYKIPAWLYFSVTSYISLWELQLFSSSRNREKFKHWCKWYDSTTILLSSFRARVSMDWERWICLFLGLRSPVFLMCEHITIRVIQWL